MRVAIVALVLAFLTVPSARSAESSDVRSRTRNFLDAYVRQDSKTVLESVDDATIMYGSDAGEVFRGTLAVKAMLANDARLWAGTAHIGQMRDVSVFIEGNMQTIFFQAPFSVADRPPVLVRFCMVWRHSGGLWHLLQSSNAVVTQGQSADHLLKQQSP